MGYIIATGPRSGSWLLCELLERTGFAGRPGEYACRADEATWRDHYRYASHLHYFFDYPRLSRTSNGVFGTKLHYPQWQCLRDDVRRYVGRADTMEWLDGLAGPLRIVRLRRRDTVRQAVSLARAQQTGEWSRRFGDCAPGQPKYDAEAIRTAYDRVRMQDAGWEQELRSCGIPVIRIDYEDLAADPAASLRSVLGFLDLPAPADVVRPRLQRQADEVSEEWVARARAELEIADSPLT